MLLFALVYLGGVLTILSPCILPVLPFVFARADRPFLRGALPILLGMTATFSAVATLAVVAGGWAVQANQAGRWAALVLLGFFGLTLLLPELSAMLTKPLVAFGASLSEATDRGSIGLSLLLGVAVGFLWAPCAGPILGLVLTGAALSGASSHTSLLLFTYAAGAATSLAVALLAGRRVFTALKKSLHASEWLRRALGAGVLVAVAAIALGVDTGFLTRLSLARTSSLEERLVARLGPSPSPKAAGPVSEAGTGSSMGFPVEGELPSLEGAVDWLNSRPLTAADLKGKVVLVDFWTYSCINCLRSLPYIRAWAEKYGSQGLVVIGVHAPEFAFEKNIANVKAAVADLQVHYPVAIDNNYAIWRAFGNQYWPAHYFADAQGRIRHHHFGEGEYDESERVIQELLAEAGKTRVDPTLVAVKGTGAEAPPASKDVASPETYLGYERAAGFSSPTEALPDKRQTYVAGKPALNEWSLSGPWTIGSERVLLDAPGGGIVYRFHARDLHLVLGPGPAGKPIRFKVRIDGEAPADSHGVDTDAAGEGRVTGERLYQLVRQRGPIKDRTFEIRFQDPGVEAFAFTFG